MTGNYTIRDISIIVGGELQGKNNHDTVIRYLLIDSRKIVHAGSSLFFALAGPRRSGQHFIPELYARGVRNFVTLPSFDTTNFPEGNFIFVGNVRAALQQLAAFHRSGFHIPVIGITGSNGKTIVKEWLNMLLEKEYNIVRSPKSYNSQIGVPLSVWQMNATHTLGIFEAGISEPGEMQALQNIIRPTIGALTHIGEAHSENFETLGQKIEEKLKLFENVEWMVANGDDERVKSLILRAGLPCLFFGEAENNEVRITGIEKKKETTIIQIEVVAPPGDGQPAERTTKGAAEEGVKERIRVELPFTDKAAIENAITCCCILWRLGLPAPVIAERIRRLKPVSMRLEMKTGINHCSVINDSYIADLSSLSIALDFLQQQQQHSRHTVILSDVYETGLPKDQLYREIANALQQKKTDRFIGIGPEILQRQPLFRQACADTAFFPSTEDFLQQFRSSGFHNETILVKGARPFGFERISALLEQKAHQTALEVNLSALIHNLKQYQQRLGPSTKIMAMVKAFSYGSGSFEIANILQFHGVDYLAVAYADEGVELRKAGISLPIMVMNPEERGYPAITEYNLEPELFSFSLLSSFKTFLQQQGLQHYPVHLKIDTGMHRLGFELGEIAALAQQLSENNLMVIQSVFSHLAGSEDPALDDFTRIQAERYLEACSALQSALNYPFIRHLANSAAIIRHPGLHFDMVRLGIGLYGIDSSASGKLDLREAATLKTTIAQIKTLKAGETVGYNRRGMINKESRIATIRLGYADGYRRNLSNGVGKVMVNGRMAPVVGSIAMDMTMIDITGIPGVKEEDEVIIFGEELPVTQLALWAKTIPYEIMTGISQRVQRTYFEE